jgi:hypothetical protein
MQRRNVCRDEYRLTGGKKLLRQKIDAFEMNINDVIELHFGGLLEAGMLRIAGVVHEVVEPIPSPALQRLGDIGHKSIEQTDITGVERNPAAFLLNALISRMRDSAS